MRALVLFLASILLFGFDTAVAGESRRNVRLAVCDVGLKPRCDDYAVVETKRIVTSFSEGDAGGYFVDSFIEFGSKGKKLFLSLARTAFDSGRSLVLLDCAGRHVSTWMITKIDELPAQFVLQKELDAVSDFSVGDLVCDGTRR